MPISNKIKDQIELLDVEDDLKKLMICILEIEDKGTYKFKEAYEKAVKAYLEKSKANGDETND